MYGVAMMVMVMVMVMLFHARTAEIHDSRRTLIAPLDSRQFP